MSPVIRRVGIALLQILSGVAILYLANRLSVHDQSTAFWVDPLLDATGFQRNWWCFVLNGLGAALLLMSLPSPWRGDRVAPARAMAPMAAPRRLPPDSRLAERPQRNPKAFVEQTTSPDASPVVRSPASPPTAAPNFRSKPSPSRPLRQLVLTGPASSDEE